MINRIIIILTIAVQIFLGGVGAYVLINNIFQDPSACAIIISLGAMLLGFGAGIKGIIQLLRNK